MLEVLQKFSGDHLISLVWVILLSWLIWPVLCGILGARRGQGALGVAHGFCWGPLGLPIVLLTSRKCVCPTCGKRTLSRRAAAQDTPVRTRPVTAASVVGNEGRPRALPVAAATGLASSEAEAAVHDAPPPVIERRAVSAWKMVDAEGVLERPDEDCHAEDAEGLFAWVNGESPCEDTRS